MSGPTWLPPQQPSSPALCNPPKKYPLDPTCLREQNGAGQSESGHPPAGPGNLPSRSHDPRDPFGRGYPMQGSALQSGAHRPSSIDAQIDSLTSMLADIESAGPQRRGDRQNFDSIPYPSATGPHKPGSFAPKNVASAAFSGPAPPYGAAHARSPAGPRTYPQPTPASYTTTSAAAGPALNVQVKVAQPVFGYGQSRCRVEHAYGPPSPGRRAQRGMDPGSRGTEGWYLEPGGYGQRLREGEAYGSKPGEAHVGAYQTPGKEEASIPARAPAGGGGYQHQTPPRRPEEELDRLTQKLVHDMNHPPAGEYFGRCARCGENVVGDGTGCVAMDQIFHTQCFTCVTCQAQLRGQPFYAMERRAYCEACYVGTLEKCSTCSKAILDRILRAMGKAFHPQCFTCVVCHQCLDGVPFTVDATSQVHCIEDFHRKFAPRCSVCENPIMPEPGQEETVRIVALDRSFHIGCYKCEECGLLLSSEGEGRGCYPLDGHILCKSCSARHIQDLSAKITTDC